METNDNIFEKVRLTKYGYFELREKPNEEELKNYYVQKYYQTNQGNYQNSYSEEETKYIFNKISQKFAAVQKYAELNATFSSSLRLLDVGSGEGFALKFFKNIGWDVVGLDFSTSGCESQNPDLLQYMIEGDIFENIQKLADADEKFDLVWLDNVLEHVLDPLNLLENCRKLTKDEGALVIEVPNDFSLLQKFLFEQNDIIKPFWVAIPDHISYFNKEGLTSICNKGGWTTKFIMGDFPIDLLLLDPDSNYISDKSKGKNAHRVRVKFENLIHSQSVETTNKLYELLLDLGIGRQLIGIFQKNKKYEAE